MIGTDAHVLSEAMRESKDNDYFGTILVDADDADDAFNKSNRIFILCAARCR